MLDHALQLARDRFAVFPCHTVNLEGGVRCSCREGRRCTSPGKHPAISGWREAASRDPAQVQAWWAERPWASIGADAERSGVFVLDFERRGLPLLKRLLAERPLPGLVMMSRTGGGGIHVFCEPISPWPFPFSPSKTNICDGLDLRGPGSQVILPPSPHESGHRYAWDQYLPDQLAPSGWGRWAIERALELAGKDPGAVSEGAGKGGRRRGPFRLPEVIPELERHDTLFRYGAKLRGQGGTHEEVERKLLAANAERCKPPQPEHEVRKLARDICQRYEAGSPSPIFDEWGLVQRIRRELVHPQADSISSRQERWSYGEGIWGGLGLHGVVRLCEGWAGEPYLDAAGRTRKYRPKMSLNRQVHEHLCLLDHRPTFFDRPPPGAAFADGFLTGDGVVVPHSPEHRARHKHEWALGDVARATCSGWLRFLDDTFAGAPDKAARIARLQEAFGAILCGVGTLYQQALILEGGGNNGKSVIIAVACAIVPRSAVISIEPQGLEHEYGRALLEGALLNAVADLSDANLVATGPIKAAIDGSIMQARRLRQDPYNYRSIASHLFGCNKLPRVRDLTKGFWRRWGVLGCPNEVPKAQRIVGLERHFIERELRGIVRWAIEGARRLAAQRGYTQVPSSDARLAAWRVDVDPAAEFQQERLVPDPSAFATAKQIFAVYRAWAAGAGYDRYKLTRRQLLTRLGQLGLESTTARIDGRVRRGYRVRIVGAEEDGQPFGP